MKRIVILAVLLLAGGGAYWAWRASRKERPLVLSGTVEARDAEVGSLVGGRVAPVRVDEGSTVRGQVRSSSRRTSSTRRSASSRGASPPPAANLTGAARAARRGHGARPRRGGAAERERQRLEALRRRGRAAARPTTPRRPRPARPQETLLEQERGNRPEDIAAARAAWRARRDSSPTSSASAQEPIVRSPAGGVIEIDRPAAGRPRRPPTSRSRRSSSPSQLWVRVYVPEPQLGRVRVGQKALLTVDTYPEARVLRPRRRDPPRRPSTRRGTSRRSTSAWTRSSA